MIKYSESESVFAVATVINPLIFFFFFFVHRAELLLSHTTNTSVNLIFMQRRSEVQFLAAFGIRMFWAVFQRQPFSKFARHSRTHNCDLPHRSQRESTAYRCLYPHINKLTHRICVYISEGSQIRLIRRRGADFSAVPAQLGRRKPCHVSGFWRVALIPIEPHGCHQRSAAEAQTHSHAQKPGECQKWHNENNESRLHTAKDGEGCLWSPGKLVFIL